MESMPSARFQPSHVEMLRLGPHLLDFAIKLERTLQTLQRFGAETRFVK